jgi:hypothetical protein
MIAVPAVVWMRTRTSDDVSHAYHSPTRRDETKMLHELRGLHGSTLHALDGEVGKADEILFVDVHWTVRYLIVDTGSWLSSRMVLVSPLAFGLMDWEHQTLFVSLTRDQIERSPRAETDKPVSRQWQNAIVRSSHSRQCQINPDKCKDKSQNRGHFG